MDKQVKCGISRAKITPTNLKKAIFLTGIGGERNDEDIKVLDDLYIRAIWLKSNGKDLIMINGDLLYFSGQTCSDICKWVEETYSVEGKYVILNATHTHCSFHPGGPFFDRSKRNRKYQETIVKGIKQAVSEAFGDLTKSKIYIAETKCRIAVNRRKAIIKAGDLKRMSFKRSFANRPNPKGAVDNDLYVIKIIREREPACFLINYACHPSILRGKCISADFPGRVEPALKGFLGEDVSVLYLQGFSGNIRPNILAPESSFVKSPKKFLIERIEGRHFEKDTSEKHVNEIGARIVNHLIKIPDEEYEEIEIKPFSKEVEIHLPLNSIPSKEYFLGFHPVTEAERDWASYVIENYDSFGNLCFKIKRVDLNMKYSFLCMPGEVFCEYSIIAKKMISNRKTISLGYSNGMVGYIPTAQAIREGGYEVNRAYKMYGLPCPFSEDIEETVIDGMRILYED
jgi:hypothetical protein